MSSINKKIIIFEYKKKLFHLFPVSWPNEIMMIFFSLRMISWFYIDTILCSLYTISYNFARDIFIIFFFRMMILFLFSIDELGFTIIPAINERLRGDPYSLLFPWCTIWFNMWILWSTIPSPSTFWRSHLVPIYLVPTIFVPTTLV